MRYLCRQARPLAALHRRVTFYEAALIGPSGQLVAVLAYDAKRTNRALLQAIYNHGPEIARMAGVDPDNCAVEYRADAWRIGEGGFRVAWSGATEYQRACEALQQEAA